MIQLLPSRCIGAGCQLLKSPAIDTAPAGASPAGSRTITVPAGDVDNGTAGAGRRPRRCVSPTLHVRREGFQYRGSGASWRTLPHTVVRAPTLTPVPSAHTRSSRSVASHFPTWPHTVTGEAS